MSAERRSVRAQNVRAWRSAAGAAIVLTFVILVIFFLGGARSARPDPGS